MKHYDSVDDENADVGFHLFVSQYPNLIRGLNLEDADVYEQMNWIHDYNRMCNPNENDISISEMNQMIPRYREDD